MKITLVIKANTHELEDMVKMNFHSWLCRLLKCGETKKRMVRFGWSVEPPKLKERNKVLELTITNEQQVNVKLVPVTATGKPAKLDGAPTWTVLSGLSNVNVASDGLSADLVSSGDPGDTEIMVKGDADLGSGFEEISDVIRLHVAGAKAANLGLVAGDPTPKP